MFEHHVTCTLCLATPRATYMAHRYVMTEKRNLNSHDVEFLAMSIVLESPVTRLNVDQNCMFLTVGTEGMIGECLE